MSQNLIFICLVAFVSVMVLLSLMAAFISVVTKVFPARKQGVDAAVAGAISVAVARTMGGARVVKMEEIE